MLSFNEEGNEYFMTREHIDKELPKGWKWINDWQIDINGSVAADGKSLIVDFMLAITL